MRENNLANIWFTGLSGSGKSTLARRMKDIYPEYTILDGDILRRGLSSDLEYTKEDREENIRRVIELCKLYTINNRKVITAFISPFKKDRKRARNEIPNLRIVYCNSSYKKCEDRDVKGLYKKAQLGLIKNFTGRDSEYQVSDCDLELDTENRTIDECIKELIETIEKRYMVFIGRWNPLHKGHKYILQQKIQETGLPILILIRDTKYEKSALQRKKEIDEWLFVNKIIGKSMIIPDIEGIYYGRGVGYNVKEIDVPENIRKISGTKIRKHDSNKPT